jgi:long-chain acyl-CoA synthetase
VNPTPISIPAAFRATAARYPDLPLVWQAPAPAGFAEVDQASDRVAAALQRGGIQPGDRVALYCINDLSFVQAYLGIQKAGGVVVPVNLLIGAEEISYILNDAGVRALIYHQAMADRIGAFRDTLEDLALVCCIGDQPHRDTDQRFSEWLAVEGEWQVVDVDPLEDLAAILYTSGTTGRPKGAMLTHQNLVSNTRSVQQALQLQPGVERLLVVLPMFHSFAATVGMLTPCLHGLTIVPVPRFDPALVSRVIGQSQATVFLGVPSMYNLILRLPDEQAVQWRSVRFGAAGGAAMPVDLLAQFEARYGFPILEGDGPTECSPVTCVNPLDATRKPGSVGLPVPDVQMMIMDGQGQPLADGEIGEICVRGPNVMKGYWNQPQSTAETFFGAWLRTGDLGYRDADGYFFMVDRIKDMIIVNGMNVYPRMIEEVLYQHPDILEAAVVGEPHESHGEIVVAHVVPVAGSALDIATVKAHCRQHLGQHQLPRKVVLREALPKNATGKILKRELRKQGEIERGIDSRE